MRTLFLSVLSLSVNILPFLVVLLLLQKKIQQQFGTRWLRLIWVAVLIRMLIIYPPFGTTLVTQNVFAPVLYDGSISEKVSVLFNQVALVDYLAAIWLVVACVLLLYRVRGYYLFQRHVRRWSKEPESETYSQIAEQVRQEWQLPGSLCVKICPVMKTPAAVGFFQPVILLPSEEYDSSAVQLILHHEAAHLRRGDVLIKWGAILVTCLYWFHPVMYFMQRELDLHLEFACDEAVIRRIGQDNDVRKAYSYIILATAAGKTGYGYPFAACLQDTREYLKKRINHIFDTRPKKSGFPVLVFSAFLMMMSSGILELEYYDTRSIELLPEVQYEAAISSRDEAKQSIVTVDLYRLEEQLENQEV